MIRRQIAFVLLLGALCATWAFARVDPRIMVQRMGRGTNLGNTLEAAQEGNWAAPAQEFYFDDYKDAGYTCVRIPVRWDKHTQVDSPYTVDADWMDRVEQVADWGLDRGLVVIINAHHDDWLYENFPQNLPRFESIWRQIAERFKDKPDNLLFEIINEPYFDLSKEQVDTLNRVILNIIRQTNPERNVIITGGGKNSYLAPLQMDVPHDDHLIAYFHYYRPFSFTHGDTPTWGSADDKAAIRENFQEVADWSARNNIPVLLGEFGVDNRKEAASRLAWYQTVVNEARRHGFAYTVWDAGPKSNKFTYYRQKNSWIVGQLNILSGQAAFGDSLPVLPAVLQAENFDRGGQGIAYNDFDSLNTSGYYRPREAVEIDTLAAGGYAVYFDHAGEWTEYTFDVDSAATYVLTVYGGGDGKSARIRLRFNGQSPGKIYTLPPQTADGSFACVRDTFRLEKETNQVRLTAVDSAVRIDKMEFALLPGQPVVQNLLKNPGFELGTQYWEGNNCILTPVDSPRHSGQKALLVGSRKAFWAAPQQPIADLLNEKGPGIYTLRAFARAIGDTGVYGKVTVMLSYNGQKHYFGEKAKLDTAAWTEITARLKLQWQGTLDEAKFYVETISPYNGNFYVDDTYLGLDSSLTALADRETNALVPDRLRLSNFPNPFNPRTTLRFTLPRAGRVRIDIFDVRGRKIRTLLNQTVLPGRHRVVWNARDKGQRPLPSGIYFARIRMGAQTDICKMMLIR